MFLGLIFTPEAGALIPQMCEVSCNKVSKKPASRQPDLQIDLRPAITAFMEAAGLPTPLSASFMPGVIAEGHSVLGRPSADLRAWQPRFRCMSSKVQ